jgi:transcriptional regulator with PAS, ATPase and Fis domain
MDEFGKPSGIQGFRKPKIIHESHPISDLTSIVIIKETGREAFEKAEKEIISETLEKTRWNRKKAAAVASD